MSNFNYPLSFLFKISTFHNDFTIKDSEDRTLFYVRQKLFKLKEEIMIFSDESRSEQQYSIKADRWLDFNANYTFTDHKTTEIIGKVGRKGMRSIWKANYNAFDRDGVEDYKIQEDNGWVKVGDSFLGEIPILNILTGYLFNPSYTMYDKEGNKVLQLQKKPSFFGRKFTLDKLAEVDPKDETRLILCFMMMILLERERG
ncbi:MULTISPECIES: hypothetical protein [Sphingobacterium]|jgi:uncharacterized protein YxjI|uniref:hypothetical protein n=1 Tax=Sphingobacterium TaxID=28453 RepID=UPI0004E5F277|nr:MULTISPECIES: hypothetical protein [Sphingobacterium]UXD68038.1 hypothetical protein MUK51_12475 [Sphingobacterium faecium]WGQ15745.1 hypothetical protein QG727_04895 [Sphingobacterium faecium]CDT17213.1 conserved hypothetical protein [Sphingobacterium sp. PM2-P1-29]SJN48514.1 hypothetical protein FM120_21430 [Sphingobacterium faecium PCAi_F2.5]